MYGLVSLFALVGSEWVSFIFITTLENEEGDIGEEAYYHSYLFQEENQDLYQGKPSQCLLLYYLSLSIMHVLLLKVFQNENNFSLCEYYYY